MTIPTMPPPATGEAPASRSDRFFLWIAGLGLARTDGWIGGVSAGIAARLRIDSLIVRGVLVVAALFGLPVIFLYAVAWALLPDAEGRVHARDLIRGDYQPVQLGIVVTVLVGLIPSAPVVGGWIAGLWYNPYQYEQFNSSNWSPLSLFGWIVGLTLVGVLLVFIVRAARRTPGASSRRPSMASTDAAAPDASAALFGSGTVDGADATESDAGGLADSAAPASALIDAPPIAPDVLPAGEHTPDDLDAWRQQHSAWKDQDQAWRRRQQDAERAAREQARSERQAVAVAFAAEAAERRRIRRASNPRAGFAFVASAIGLALVSGAGMGLWNGGDQFRLAVGLLTAALVFAVGMILAGALRHRSGFLAFLAVVTLLSGAVATGAATLPQLTFGDASVSNTLTVGMQQPFGALSINLQPQSDAPRSITVDKGTGNTSIAVAEGVELELLATVDSASIVWSRVDRTTGAVLDVGTWQGQVNDDGERVFSETIAAENSPTLMTQLVTINQTAGEIHVTVFDSKDGAE